MCTQFQSHLRVTDFSLVYLTNIDRSSINRFLSGFAEYQLPALILRKLLKVGMAFIMYSSPQHIFHTRLLSKDSFPVFRFRKIK